MLQRLKEAGLCTLLKKSTFHVTEVEYLGYIISKDGVSMAQDKVQRILEWPAPRTEPKHIVTDVRSFIGFCNFYRRFIEGYSKICKPLNDLTKKDTVLVWSAACEAAFQKLKDQFKTAPLLVHFEPDRSTVVETNTSDFALACILSQIIKATGRLHPMAFQS